MAPNTEIEDTIYPEPKSEKLIPPQASPRKHEIIYFNVFFFAIWNLAGIYGFYLAFTAAKWSTILFSFFMYSLAEIGLTAGAHRLWSHKSYKVKPWLEIVLMLWNSIAFQNTAVDWVRNHKMHHKYSDTDGDPHNASRGFFFSHMGWLLVKKHPEIRKRGKYIDMTDIHNNPILMFQKKYAIPVLGTMCFAIPTIVPMFFWGETFINAWFLNMARLFTNFHMTFLVNSATHKFGTKPYDKDMMPAQNLFVSLLTFGEGFHNYHHVFPWDYRGDDDSNIMANFTTNIINFWAKMGWAYDLKTAPDHIIYQRTKRTGDINLLRWHDKNLVEEEKLGADIFYPESKLES